MFDLAISSKVGISKYVYLILSGAKVETSGSDGDSNIDSELSSHSLPTHYQAGWS